MSSDIAKQFDSLPGWVIPVTVGGVVILGLLQSGGTKRGTTGATTVYSPVNADPGLVSLAEREVSARESVYTSALNIFGQRDISRISADRDVTISGMNASVANARTRASEAIGLAQTDAQTKISLADFASRSSIANTQAARDRAVADSQGATAKYVAKKQNNPWNTVIKTVGSVISSIFG